MDFDMVDDDISFDLPSPAALDAVGNDLTSGGAAAARRRKALPIHRCRFPDWSPAAISALAITPASFDASLLGFGGSSAERGVLAVGKANGDVDLMLWGGYQGWVAWRTLPSSFPLPKTRSSKKPSSLLSHLVWTHQTTLSPSDLDLYEGDLPGAEQELRRLQREGVRLFGVGGVGSELVEWEWGGPGSGKAVGMVKSTLPTLPPIFALAASPSSASLAIACEDSTIRILNILDGELELVSKIEVGGPGKVRALSLAWGAPVEPLNKGKERASSPSESSLPSHFATLSESYLIAGCSNSTIRRFDVPTSGSIAGVWRGGLRMTLDRIKGEQTVVWTVAILEDGMVVSGDSMGNVKFWDGEMGTQSQSFRSHKADVLCLAIGSDGTSLFTSGVDQKTVEFRLVTVASSRTHAVPAGRWIQASGRRLHSHDVRAIVVSPPYALPSPTALTSQAKPSKPLVPVMTSGGLDLSLILTAVSAAPPKKSRKGFATALQNPVSNVPSIEFESTTHRRAAYVPQRARAFSVSSAGAEGRLLVARRERSVGIWRLEDPKKAGSEGVQQRWGSGKGKVTLGLREQAVSDEADEDEEDEEFRKPGWQKVTELELKLQTNLISSAVSSDGKWLAVSDLYETKLFRLSSRNGDLIPRRQKTFSPALSAALPAMLGTGSSCLTFTKDSQRLILSTAFGSSIAVIQLPATKIDEFEVVAVFGEGSRAASSKKSIANGFTNGKAKDAEDVEMNGAEESDSDSDDSGSDSEDERPAVAARGKPVSVACLAVSADGKWLASADLDRNVVVYDLGSLQPHVTLPTPPAVPTSLSFLPPSTTLEPTLLLALPSNSLLLYGLTSRRFHPWALPLSSSKYNLLTDIREPALGVTFEPTTTGPGRQVALVWGANWVAKVDLDELRTGGAEDASSAVVGENGAAAASKQPHSHKKKKAPFRLEADRKRARDEDDDLPLSLAASAALETKPQPLDIKVTRRYQPLCLFEFVGQGELVAVERTWFDLARELPEAWVKAGQFGT
ncbi:hypothetical protein JCM1841_001258 [Sporobolomyces salmonicolor]